MSSNFFINNKKEFLLTYADTFNNNLTLENISNFFSNGEFKDIFEYVVAQEKGHESGDIHDHFHLYLNYIGSNKRGFSKKGANAELIFDIPLLSPVWRYHLDKKPHYINESDYFQDVSKFSNFETKRFANAHPNIKFKGDKNDPNCKNTLKMLKYVTKHTLITEESDWKIISTFDWKERINKLTKNDPSGEKKLSKKDEMEMEFTEFLKDKILEGYTENDIIPKTKEVWHDLPGIGKYYRDYIGKIILLRILVQVVNEREKLRKLHQTQYAVSLGQDKFKELGIEEENYDKKLLEQIDWAVGCHLKRFGYIKEILYTVYHLDINMFKTEKDVLEFSIVYLGVLDRLEIDNKLLFKHFNDKALENSLDKMLLKSFERVEENKYEEKINELMVEDFNDVN